MKKNIAFCAMSFLSMTAFSQNTFPATGTAGIGTSTPNAGFNAQIHGTTAYTNLSTYYTDWEGVFYGTVAGSSQGITSRLGFTNTTVGATGTDGTILRQSGYDFVIDNLEKRTVILQSNRAFLKVDGIYNRVNVGEGIHNTAASAAFNVYTPYDNGISIETNYASMYGLKIKVKYDSEYATKIYGTSTSVLNFATMGSGKTTIYNNAVGLTNTAFSINNATTEYFSLKGNGALAINSSQVAALSTPVISVSNGASPTFTLLKGGEVQCVLNSATATDKVFTFSNNTTKLLQLTNDGVLRGRGMKLDVMTWADYVFEDNYNLRSLEEVKEYIDINGHLPEVPSTAEVTENGIDVGEMNTILLKKVEELTLYLLEQDVKIKSLENSIEQLINK